MAGNLNGDGSIVWFTSTDTTTPIVLGVDTGALYSSFLSGLYACDIKTSLLGKSLKVEHLGVTVAFIELKGITSFDLLGDTIVLYTTDQVPFTLIFINSTEALGGYAKIELALNGGYVDCSTEATLTKGLTLVDVTTNQTLDPSANPYPGLLFVNGIPVKKIASQLDAVTYFNNVSGGNYICNFGINSNSFNFSYKNYQSTYIPTSLSIESNFFTITTASETLDFIYDTTANSFWCVGNNGGLISTDPFFNFGSIGVNVLDVFYSTDYAAAIDLSNNGVNSLTGRLPLQLSSFTMINSTVPDFNFLSPLTNLQQLDLEGNFIATTLPSFSVDKLVLSSVTLKNLSITSLASFSNLPSLATLYVDNIQIASTPPLSVSDNLVYLAFNNCYFLTTISPLTQNTQLQYFVIDNAPALTSIPITFTTNTLLTNLQVTKTNVTSLPSLINNHLAINVLLDNNNFSIVAIQNFVHDLANNVIGASGRLTFTNQVGNYDPSVFNQTFLDDIERLRIVKVWEVQY